VIALPARRFGTGLGWVAWPCGLLQSALLVAGLANTAVQGALVMAAFAAASALGLLLGPALWWRLSGGAANRWMSPHLAVRLAGLALALASAWALGHGLWLRVAAWCFS
jgi:sulfite exporter TauE/SafE